MMLFDPTVEARLKSLEDKLVTPEDMQQLRTECVMTADYNTHFVPSLNSLETTIVQVKEQSEPNWTVASGCATRILANKFNSLLKLSKLDRGANQEHPFKETKGSNSPMSPMECMYRKLHLQHLM